MKHAIVAMDFVTYQEAFDAAAKIAGSRRKTTWHGKVRIKYRTTTERFEVQVPA